MSRPALRFTRHYLEMLAAMVAGMVVLGMPAEAALRAVGTSSAALEADAPALLLAGMAVIMTVPMVAWMRHRGHGRRPCLEMAASMFLPALGATALLWSGLVEDFGTLMVAEHVAMLPSMLVAMLLRPQEYTHGAHGGQAAPQELTA